jgi:hypothetical protein
MSDIPENEEILEILQRVNDEEIRQEIS